jgi:hypothetical protein
MEAPCFTVELDLVLHFVPPMSPHSNGLVLTRKFQLPFPPYDGLLVFSNKMDDCPDPEGMMLKHVVWDIDRRIFLARTQIQHDMLPIALIPVEVRSWIDLGWRLGSCRDKYAVEYPDDEVQEASPRPDSLEDEASWPELDEDELESWATLPPRKRPARFNRLLRALVRHMSETYDNLSVAYAMDQTKRYFDEEEVKKSDNPAVDAWRKAEQAFMSMSDDEQTKWQKHVERHYPRLDRLI